MTDLIARNSKDIAMQLPGLVSMPGDERYASATSTWAKQRGVAPRFVVHCRTASDVQTAIRVAREQNLPLSVRGGGHDWAGRALCDGVVIDLTGMRSVILDSDRRAVTAGGGALVSDITAITDAHGVAVVAGSVGSVGMTGLTLGGGYGPLIGRFGLALDNVLDMQIVLADGRIEFASAERNEELFWALRGGGGNFGVVTAMRHLLHELPGVHSGMPVFPFSEAKSGWTTARPSPRRRPTSFPCRSASWAPLMVPSSSRSFRRGAARRSKATAGSRQCCASGPC